MTKPAANSIEGIAEPFLQRIENLNGDLETLRGKYMADCKAVREEVGEVYSAAKEKGVAKKSLKRLVKHRQLTRQIEKLADGLDIDEQSQFESLVGAFGQLEMVLKTPAAQAA